MKKILVVLLILSVAGGVFAQDGNWSVSGEMAVGTRINFDPDPDVDNDDPALVDGIGFFEYDAIYGKATIAYTGKEGLWAGLGFSTAKDTWLDFTFNGENFKGQFVFNQFLNSILGGTGNWSSVGRLWGEYGFFDGMVTLEAAYNSRGTEYWVSDTTGAFKGNEIAVTIDKYGNGPNWAVPYAGLWVETKYDNPPNYDGRGVQRYGSWERNSTNPFGWHGDTFTKVDHNNYLLAAVGLGNLNFGVQIPNMFVFRGTWATYGSDPTGTKFVDDALRHTKLGVSFDYSPFEFAAQFYLEKYGIYFGGTYTAGPLKFGLSFMGELDGDGKKTKDAMGNVINHDADPTHIKIGGRAEYATGPLGAGLKAFYDRQELYVVDNSIGGATTDLDAYISTIGVEPFFFYDAVPSYLRFRLDAGIYFLNLTDGTDDNKETVWALQPQVVWNFLGTGAAADEGWYWPLQTAILIKYRLVGADVRDTFGGNSSVNFLDVVFKWSF